MQEKEQVNARKAQKLPTKNARRIPPQKKNKSPKGQEEQEKEQDTCAFLGPDSVTSQK